MGKDKKLVNKKFGRFLLETLEKVYPSCKIKRIDRLKCSLPHSSFTKLLQLFLLVVDVKVLDFQKGSYPANGRDNIEFVTHSFAATAL